MGRLPTWVHGLGAQRALAPFVLAVTFAMSSGPAYGADLPAGFQDTAAFGGLTDVTQVEFSPDGRVFVGEKSGLVKVFDNLTDTTPSTVADLRTNVFNGWDRGLLGLAMDPGFPAEPYIYVLYTHDAEIGGTAPKWGDPGVSADPCPTPPGYTADGCVVSGRLSRLELEGNSMVDDEEILVEDWCQQYSSHSVGDIAFGSDGALYASGGEGASFIWADYGQTGAPGNPCGDPPAGVGGTMTAPSAEGGALRSQDALTTGDPMGLGGSVIRVDPDTGAGLPGNPYFSSSDPNRRRVVATGLRNPFRMTTRPGTSEVWVVDPGWDDVEEINRIDNPTASQPKNFGWPCWEGTAHQPDYTAAGLELCRRLHEEDSGLVSGPYYGYNHQEAIPDRDCPTGTSSIAGLGFYPDGGPFPSPYRGALFFLDYARSCIWAIPKGTNGLPDTSQITTLTTNAPNPVDLEIGPDGSLYYVSYRYGEVHRIRYFPGNEPPIAVADATPRAGPVPLTVEFDATGSSDPEGGALTYEWDLDGDGQYDDSTAAEPSHTYNQAGVYTASVRVTDRNDDSATASVTISAGNTAPTATILSPDSWPLRIGERVDFAGGGTDGQDGPLGTSAMEWSLDMEHCPAGCHTHGVQRWSDVFGESFFVPDHELPSHLVLTLEVTDAGGLSDTDDVRMDLLPAEQTPPPGGDPPPALEPPALGGPAGDRMTIDDHAKLSRRKLTLAATCRDPQGCDGDFLLSGSFETGDFSLARLAFDVGEGTSSFDLRISRKIRRSLRPRSLNYLWVTAYAPGGGPYAERRLTKLERR